ncbi:hypothetical protein EMIT0111MI5_90174 [Burkholderia sp. IT-111MI5]
MIAPPRTVRRAGTGGVPGRMRCRSRKSHAIAARGPRGAASGRSARCDGVNEGVAFRYTAVCEVLPNMTGGVALVTDGRPHARMPNGDGARPALRRLRALNLRCWHGYRKLASRQTYRRSVGARATAEHKDGDNGNDQEAKGGRAR